MLLNRKTKWDGTINLPYVLEIVHFENSLAFAITNTLRYRKKNTLFADLNALYTSKDTHSLKSSTIPEY